MRAVWEKGGGDRRTHSLFPRVSFPTSRAHQGRRKEEENAPIRNERRMFLSSLVSHFRVLTRRAHTIDYPKIYGGEYDDTSSPLFPGKEDVAK